MGEWVEQGWSEPGPPGYRTEDGSFVPDGPRGYIGEDGTFVEFGPPGDVGENGTFIEFGPPGYRTEDGSFVEFQSRLPIPQPMTQYGPAPVEKFYIPDSTPTTTHTIFDRSKLPGGKLLKGGRTIPFHDREDTTSDPPLPGGADKLVKNDLTKIAESFRRIAFSAKRGL